MHCDKFMPEGTLIYKKSNLTHLSSSDALEHAMNHETIVEGEVLLCDAEHNLTVDLNGYIGIIPHRDTAIGIDEGTTREIAVISRVGKSVSCIIRKIDNSSEKPKLLLSRKAAQQKAILHLMNNLTPGDIIPARVTHLEPFGVFVDIGCGNISLVGIESLSVSRISHPKDRFRIGDDLFVIVTGLDFNKKRISLSLRELLGTWSENAERFEAGQTVRGIVRGIEDYGIFIELAPNLSGLAEFCPDVKIGDAVSVFIKNIIPNKMKIKLIVIDIFRDNFTRYITRDDYFLTKGRIDRWQYSPSSCTKKQIISDFQNQE